MRLTKGETKDFNDYEVVVQRQRRARRQLPLLRGYKLGLWWVWETVETVLSDVIEADEETKIVTTHAADTNGFPQYENGKDVVALDNAVKVMLLVPQFWQAFIAAEYKAKMTRTYEPTMKIREKR